VNAAAAPVADFSNCRLDVFIVFSIMFSGSFRSRHGPSSSASKCSTFRPATPKEFRMWPVTWRGAIMGHL
jgi:hypothetical protein